jgi:hypothetical protein
VGQAVLFAVLGAGVGGEGDGPMHQVEVDVGELEVGEGVVEGDGRVTVGGGPAEGSLVANLV